jgi:hypothetical protein
VADQVPVGLPVRPLAVYPGSAVSWENHRFPGRAAFVVELHAGALTAAGVMRYGNAVLAVGRG